MPANKDVRSMGNTEQRMDDQTDPSSKKRGRNIKNGREGAGRSSSKQHSKGQSKVK